MYFAAAISCLTLLLAPSTASTNDALQALALVNQARQVLRVQPLQWDSNLAAYAQYWANLIAANQQPFSHAPPQLRPQQGENIYQHAATHCDPNTDMSFQDGQPVTTGQEPWLHWSQCVWKDTTHMGCGLAYSTSESCKYYVVCRYVSQGNILGQRPF
ncbi:basic form of pathogenesis protein 1 [Mariannaea sp. PMI_226]|nr:basic form of pathogenesis protein 1 [Mariannaea sp. PMI_226]